MNNSTKFVILIPTRERCDTLEATLRSCIHQDYDNLEIVVSDNFSQDGTKQVVTSFNDPRIRYINTGRRVSMTENWEFALSHVKGGYVTFIGDDDGLLPTAIERLNRIIKELGTPTAITWKIAHYGWPSHTDENERNRMLVPLGKALKRWEAKKMLQELTRFKVLYYMLPSLYNSFVNYEIIKKVIDLSQGQFFHSATPDVYSSVALAAVMDEYYYSFRPYTVSGVSHHSHGAAQLGEGGDPQARQKYLSETNIPFHKKLVTAPAVAILTAEAFLQAQDHLPPAQDFELDIKDAILYALRVAAIQSPKQYQAVVEAVQKIGQINDLEAYTAKAIAENPNRPKDNRPIIGYNIAFNTLRLQTDDFGVKNIYDACLLCDHILTLNEHGYHTLPGIVRATLKFVTKYLKGGGDHFARAQKFWTLR